MYIALLLFLFYFLGKNQLEGIVLRFNTEINIQIFHIIEFKLISDNKIIIIEKKIDYIPFEEHAAMRDFPSVYRS